MKIFDSIKASLVEHSTDIAAGLGIAGFITATGFAIKGTVDAVRLVDKKKEELKVDKLTIKETAETVWPCYVPTAVTTVVSGGLVIFSAAGKNAKTAALTTALSMTEEFGRMYQDKVVEVVGEKKEKEIRNEVAKEQLKANPPAIPSNEVRDDVYTPIIYEPMTKKYIRTTPEAVRKAVNDYNRRLLTGGEMYLSYNEFLYAIGIAPEPTFDMYGNNVDKLLDIDFAPDIWNDRPVLAIIFTHGHEPFTDYTRV